MKVGYPVTCGVTSLEADEDGTSGGAQRWRTRSDGNLTTSTRRIWPFQEGCWEAGMCRVYNFFLFCHVFSSLLRCESNAVVSFWLCISFVDIGVGLMNPLSKKDANTSGLIFSQLKFG